MNCNQCGNGMNGPGDVCPACVAKEKIILFDTVEAAAKDAEAQPPGIISIRHVVRYGDKFVIVLASPLILVVIPFWIIGKIAMLLKIDKLFD